jgi:hypothetical protein
MVWAFHSESQGLLLDAINTACNGKMLWSDARALGIALWLNSTDELVCIFCYVARGIINISPIENAAGKHCAQ